MIKYLLILTLFASTMISCQEKTAPVVDEEDKKEAFDETEEIIPFVEKFPSGQTKTLGNNQNGKKVGKWITYQEDGKLWSETNYYQGERSGISKSYFPNGMLRFRGGYVNDLREGPWYFYSDDGKIEKKVNFHRGEESKK